MNGWTADQYHDILEYVAASFILDPDNPFLQDGIPEFISLLWKAGFHAGYEKAKQETENPDIPF